MSRRDDGDPAAYPGRATSASCRTCSKVALALFDEGETRILPVHLPEECCRRSAMRRRSPRRWD